MIALSIYYLWQILGVASITGVVIMILLIPINSIVGNKLKYLQIKEMHKKDERIKTISEILSGIKLLKLYAWEASFEAAVQKIRAKELQIIRNNSVVYTYVFLIWNLIPFVITIAAFATFVLIDPDKNKITSNTVFVSITLFNIMRVPLTLFPIMTQKVMQAWVSVIRINDFLNAANLDENVVTRHKDEGIKHLCLTTCNVYCFQSFKDNAIRMENASFEWGSEEMAVKNINLEIAKGTLAAVVGLVGSGKSSLIASILGETVKCQGSVNTDGTMAYVAQQAWIQNATLRVNSIYLTHIQLFVLIHIRLFRTTSCLVDLSIGNSTIR